MPEALRAHAHALAWSAWPLLVLHGHGTHGSQYFCHQRGGLSLLKKQGPLNLPSLWRSQQRSCTRHAAILAPGTLLYLAAPGTLLYLTAPGTLLYLHQARCCTCTRHAAVLGCTATHHCWQPHSVSLMRHTAHRVSLMRQQRTESVSCATQRTESVSCATQRTESVSCATRRTESVSCATRRTATNSHAPPHPTCHHWQHCTAQQPTAAHTRAPPATTCSTARMSLATWLLAAAGTLAARRMSSRTIEDSWCRCARQAPTTLNTTPNTCIPG